ncbi:armadillo-type protein [Lipomyces kononenkoae]|uniref:Armadillo-type protein n=1 Tax=Lipomyces kononenkoae TaxID=34357 RepID=A0ACC3SXD6_LIPKO
MADQEEDYSSLPLQDRATHKIWKVRLAAYEEMTKQFTTSASENDPCFRLFLNDPTLFKKIVTDSNVAAQEAGIASLVACLQYGGPNACQRLRGTVITPLAEKGMVSMRAGTRQKTIDALLYFIELDTPDPVVEELIPILSNKLPKLVAGTIIALREIVKSFGTKTVGPKSIVKALPKLFAHPDKNVRAEATNLTVELYRWMGDALKTGLVPDLKPVQQKELEEEFEKMKGSVPQQERFLHSQQQAAAQGNSLGGGAVEQEDEDEIDPMDFIEAVDVFGKIPGDFYERMGSVKWKDRKEAVDDLFKVVSVPKVADADFTELTRVLAKCIAKDANVAVVTVAANCVEALAKGLRAGFAKYKNTVFTSLLERLKEKKQSVSEALGAALDAVFESTTFSETLEEVLEFMKHKNPQIKQETTIFLVRCLRTVKIIPKQSEIKQMCEASTALLADTAKPVRSAAAEAMGTIMKMIGERAMTPYIDGLDDIRKNMIKEFFETATVKAKPEKAPPPTTVAPKAAARVPSGAPRPRSSAVGVKRPTSTTPNTSSGRPAPGSEPQAPPAPAHSRLAQPGARTSRVGTGSISAPRKKDDHSSSPRATSTSGTPPRSISSRGLTGVSLSTSASSSTSHSGLSAAEKAELAELRRAREDWVTSTAALKQQVDTLQADNLKLSQTIAELQVNNKQLIEDHTRDVLAVKAKETQLARARTEADDTRAQIGRLQRDLEIAKAAAAAAAASGASTTVPRADEIVARDLNDGISNVSPATRTKSESILAEEEKENGFSAPSMSRSAGVHVSRSTSRAGSFSPISTGTVDTSDIGSGNAGSVESWRRAAEVTSQLKARIEAMKARQIRR